VKNKLIDLNDHLFSQLERLGNESLTDERLNTEIDRSKAITDISKEIVSNANLQLQALKLKAEYRGLEKSDIPRTLIDKPNEG
jgi:hypothetical protein